MRENNGEGWVITKTTGFLAKIQQFLPG